MGCGNIILEFFSQVLIWIMPGPMTGGDFQFLYQTANICASAFSPHRSARVLRRLTLAKRRGRREDRVRAAPAVSCATRTAENAHEHTGSAETLRPSPRNGFTAYSALSLVTGFVATIASGNLFLKSLTPASGRQDHAISPSASRAVRQRRIRVHRISPHVRDDREPPLIG